MNFWGIVGDNFGCNFGCVSWNNWKTVCEIVSTDLKICGCQVQVGVCCGMVVQFCVCLMFVYCGVFCFVLQIVGEFWNQIWTLWWQVL